MQSSPVGNAGIESLPEDVLLLASKLGVVSEIESLLAATQAIFPGEAVSIRLEEDPELADDEHFVFVTTASGDVDSIVTKHDCWHRNLRAFRGPRLGLFRLGIEAQ